MRIYLFILISLLTLNTKAQNIYGTISKENGEAVPFANIYINELKLGTCSNIEGYYEIEIPSGEWTISYQYIGYRTETTTVTIKTGDTKLDIKLKARDYKISEIKVLASGEDPAYYVMRKAIAMGEYYTQQIEKYTCEVYLKGKTEIIDIPFLLSWELKSSNIEKGKTYITENITNISFHQPNLFSQETIAIHTSQIDSKIDPMPFITTNLYNTRENGLISPLDKKAFSVYKYKLVSIFIDNDFTINKIQVIPKRKGRDLFRGYINIVDNYWSIHSVDLKLNIPMAEINMHLLYCHLEKNVWLPASYNFKIKFDGLGFKANISYLASIKNYNIEMNNKIDHNLFSEEDTNNEIIKPKQKLINQLLNKKEIKMSEMRKLSRLMKTKKKSNKNLELKSNKVIIAKRAYNKDSLFWHNIRPIPLSSDEKISFSLKDSTIKITNTKKKRHSVIQKENKFKIYDILFAKEYSFKEQGVSISNSGILNFKNINFNTVDGFKFSNLINFIKQDTLGNYYNIEQKIEYTSARKKFNYSLFGQLKYNSLKRAWIAVMMANKSRDFHRYYGINDFENSFYSLFFRKNKMKLFREKSLKIFHITDITNGLTINTSVYYNKQYKLYNNTDFSIINLKNIEYSENTIQNINKKEFDNNISFTIENTIKYTHRQKYYINKGSKSVEEVNKYPSITLEYKQAFANIMKSKTQYIFLGVTIDQCIKTGIADKFEYRINTGKYYNKRNIHFSQRTHFSSNNFFVSLKAKELSFKLLDYYSQSAINKFIQINTKYTSDRLLLKRLPILNNSFFIKEVLSFNYLNTKKSRNYYEISYALSNIFMFLDIEVASSFDNNKFRDAKLKINLNF